jgi:hypothetical protein
VLNRGRAGPAAADRGDGRREADARCGGSPASRTAISRSRAIVSQHQVGGFTGVRSTSSHGGRDQGLLVVAALGPLPAGKAAREGEIVLASPRVARRTVASNPGETCPPLCRRARPSSPATRPIATGNHQSGLSRAALAPSMVGSAGAPRSKLRPTSTRRSPPPRRGSERMAVRRRGRPTAGPPQTRAAEGMADHDPGEAHARTSSSGLRRRRPGGALRESRRSAHRSQRPSVARLTAVREVEPQGAQAVRREKPRLIADPSHRGIRELRERWRTAGGLRSACGFDQLRRVLTGNVRIRTALRS